MLKKAILSVSILVVAIGLQGFTQTGSDSIRNAKLKENQDKQLKKSKNDSLRKANTNMKPTIGIGPGMFHFFGDVNHNKSVNPMIPSYGFNLNVAQHISPSFRVDFDFVMGNLTANERSVERNLNFKSRTINGSAQLTYNFAGMLKPDRVINPYISVGVGILNFDSKGDWQDAKGSTYYYWSDGSIRNIAQTDPLSETAVEIDRDYNYETDLRQANLDSLGKYSQVAFTIPVSFGFDFKVSNRMKLKLGSTFYYSFTDLIDNVSAEGVGVRKGNDAKDMYLFSSFSLHYDFFSPVKKAPEGIYKDIDFTSVVETDSDGDGVAEELDKCPDSPKESKVDKNGCPVDSDADGIPDYKDMENNTAKGMPVDADGYGLSDETITNTYKDTVGTNRSKMFEIYPDMREIYPAPSASEPQTKDEKKAESKNDKRDMNLIIQKLESGQVKPKPVKLGNSKMEMIDTNKDKQVSGIEAYTMVEEFLEGNSKLTLPEVYEIIDYLFEQ
ncbi:MAG: hypothetical protein POELPBGB_03869 [Bacteroidia bacterium]|nr:hypothetical protein [Bacteroidia bacterium]